jgi:hypothetical protein
VQFLYLPLIPRGVTVVKWQHGTDSQLLQGIPSEGEEEE